MTSAGELRELIGVPSDLVVAKQLDRVDRHARAFIACSPMVIVASADANGRCDASPRGDPPGFVRVVDDTTLLLPDRKGNRRVDTIANMTSNPHIGLLFLIPGVDETLRVNGRTSITTDETLLAPCAVNGRSPALGIVVEVEELFFHCARAFLRSSVWHPARWPDHSALPSLGEILRDQTSARIDPGDLDADLERSNRDLY